MSNSDPNSIDRFSSAFGALANRHRLQIFSMLSGCCGRSDAWDAHAPPTCCVGELGSALDIAASTLSHHLKELSRAGLIDMKRDGKRVICSVNAEMLNELRDYFQTDPEVQNGP